MLTQQEKKIAGAYDRFMSRHESSFAHPGTQESRMQVLKGFLATMESPSGAAEDGNPYNQDHPLARELGQYSEAWTLLSTFRGRMLTITNVENGTDVEKKKDSVTFRAIQGVGVMLHMFSALMDEIKLNNRLTKYENQHALATQVETFAKFSESYMDDLNLLIRNKTIAPETMRGGDSYNIYMAKPGVKAL